MAGKTRIPSSPLSDSAKSDQDRYLPVANVSRIMKRSLPANAKISKEAKETAKECVSEFISFVTGEASDKCQREKRKTINGDDLLWAMTTLGFDNYVRPLKAYISKYRESEGEKDTSMAGQDESDQDGEKFAAKKAGFLQGFNDGDYRDQHFEVGKFDGNGERAMEATSLHHHGAEWSTF